MADPVMFWCPGRGLSQVSTFDKPDRFRDCGNAWCGKYKQHGPHTWVPRPATSGKAEA